MGLQPDDRGKRISSLTARTPASAELILYSLILYIPLGIFSGVHAAGQQGYRSDSTFRVAAMFAIALPPFILGMVLLSIYYVGLYWFPLGRLGDAEMSIVNSLTYHSFTGLLTVDGLRGARQPVHLLVGVCARQPDNHPV